MPRLGSQPPSADYRLFHPKRPPTAPAPGDPREELSQYAFRGGNAFTLRLLDRYRIGLNGGQAYYDFHSHPPDADPNFFTRYEEGEGSRRAGTILVPYVGEHGWYWLNLEDHPVAIQLEAAGFYDEWVAYELGE